MLVVYFATALGLFLRDHLQSRTGRLNECHRQRDGLRVRAVSGFIMRTSPLYSPTRSPFLAGSARKTPQPATSERPTTTFLRWPSCNPILAQTDPVVVAGAAASSDTCLPDRVSDARMYPYTHM
jgi:hypothetical protein